MEEAPTQKLALVVGNADYAEHPSIPSAAVDVVNVANVLKNLGFAVTQVSNIKRSADFWNISFLPFVSRVRDNDLVVVYFSGHGLNYGGAESIRHDRLSEDGS